MRQMSVEQLIMFDIENMPVETFSELVIWLTTNANTGTHTINELWISNTVVFFQIWFPDETDAMAFKLRWI